MGVDTPEVKTYFERGQNIPKLALCAASGTRGELPTPL